MGEVLPLQKLQAKYGGLGFETLFVYTRESHPGENFPHHDSHEQKLDHAHKLRALEGVTVPILVDDLNGTVHREYGLLSNMVYLIDREGMIVYKSDWTDHRELEGMCEDLLRLEDMRVRGVPIIRSSRSERLHWIPMDPQLRERVYRRSGDKAIRDYAQVNGHLPYATDVEKAIDNASEKHPDRAQP